jgi:hypothetical protein
MQLNSTRLRKASAIAEQIEHLEEELSNLLNDGGDQNPAIKPVEPIRKSRIAVARKGLRPVSTTTSQPRNLLSSTVVDILKRSRKPLNTARIYEKLVEKNFHLNSPDQKKYLGIRLYKLAGVKSLGKGLFGLKS